MQAADGAKFPTGGSFNATVWPVSAQPTTANAEIVRVTAISTDTFTITRAQESTSARTIVVGDQIAATVTAKTLTDVEFDSSYLTSFDQAVPANTQAIYDDYLELAASFVYELASGAELIVGDFATPLPLPDQNTNIFISVADETIPKNSEAIFGDFYEVSAPFATEAGPGSLLQLGTSPSVPSLTVDATLTGDVSIASAQVGVDGPSALFAAGTWLVVYKCAFVNSGTGHAEYYVRLWDGSTTYDESQSDEATTTGTAGFYLSLSGNAIVTLAVPAVLKLTVAASTTGQTLKRDTSIGGGLDLSTHTITRLSGIRVA